MHSVECRFHENCVLQIAGAVTTYLVILIQFHVTLPNPHQNETSHVAGSA